MENFGLSYREVVLDHSNEEEWFEVQVNTGGTQSTLQDIKVAEKAGGYCFKNVQLNHNRNRFIYWRSYKDVLELSEISLDFTLYQNNLRYIFSDSPVLAVSITEQERFVTLQVVTVSSLHRFNFPHPDTLANGSSGSSASASVSCSGTSAGASIDFNESQSFSIFRDANNTTVRDPTSCYVIDTHGSAPDQPVAHAANSFLSADGEMAYFAVACQSQLMLYVMNCTTGETVAHNFKQSNLLPRLFFNLREVLGRKSEYLDAEYVTSMVFTTINNNSYLLTLYRDNSLRAWSMKTFLCESSVNCIEHSNQEILQGPQSNLLRKVNDQVFCAFLSHSNASEFICIEVNLSTMGDTPGIHLVVGKGIPAPELDLADFDVSDTRIWALWCNGKGEFSVSNIPLNPGSNATWLSAAMEPPPDQYCIGLERGMDAREAYCSYIFHPGKFDRNVISKALLMFRRSSGRFDIKHRTMAMLKEQVCQAVEDEVQNEIKDFDVSDDEYVEITMRLWQRFFSCCEQYHMKSIQPIGLLILAPIDALCVVKKKTFSLLRPCEVLEHLMLSGDNVGENVELAANFQGNEGEDLIRLIKVVAQLEKCLPEAIKIDIEKRLYQLEPPKTVALNVSKEIVGTTSGQTTEFFNDLHQKLRDLKDFSSVMKLLFEMLRLDNGNPEAMQTHISVANCTRFLMSIGALFGSFIGQSLLSETVRQMASIRFAICRNLLILHQIVLETTSFPEVMKAVSGECVPELVMFLQSYYVMVWISETPVNMNSLTALETSIQRLNMLRLTNGSGRIYTPGSKCHALPLLRVFLNAKGLYTALALYSQSYKDVNIRNWQNTLMPLTTIVGQLIWPISFNFVFGEWLVSTCQHVIIQEYVRLNQWCTWNSFSRQFILAISMLECGEIDKAYNLFQLPAQGVTTEYFFTEKILKDVTLHHMPDETDAIETKETQAVMYYLKVIQLLEQHNALDHIISIATNATKLLERHDPHLPIFQSIIFNNHLLLEHYEEAFNSLKSNVQLSRRKDCLRQLVITLFNRNRLDLLIKFSYEDLQEEFETIVESRARSLTIEKNLIYDFMFSFHVDKGNMRKASAAMYEQAMRLQHESMTVESMEKRASSLLMCITALYLIDERYQWIAKPVISDEGGTAADNEKPEAQRKKNKIVVLEIKDIRRELLQTNSIILLARHRQDMNSIINTGPTELVTILANCGLFTDAIKLANGFELSPLPIFERLTAACVHAADESANDTLTWVQENDLADIPYRNKPVDLAWSLLEKLVVKNEADNSTLIRKCVVNKLLELSAFVPQWLCNAYKLANVSEFLYLFVKHSRLLEAAELAQEMISAMIGPGSEYFSFKHPISVRNPEMCMPVNTLDFLMLGLKLNAEENIEYKQAVVELGEIIQNYMDVAERTANDKIKLAAQANRDLKE